MTLKSVKPLTSEEKRLLEKLREEESLPHIHGWRWYPWAHKFFTSTNRFNFLVAANQISKSSTQIRKCIDWATDKSKWPTLWRNTPTQFWYLYPSKPVCTSEFHEKWETEFLPRGKFKEHATYGWQAEYKNKEIHAIHFNSGVSVYFKTYEQDAQNLQTGTVYAIFADEELPFHLMGELRSRLNATNGYFHNVFTATIGQDEWRRTMEPANETEELFKGALKLQVSMYDCLKYMDGTPSFWTPQRIREIELECGTEAEVQKRVYGRFIVSGGLKVPSFDRVKNIVPKRIISPDWPVYTGVDIGSGGEKGHPSAITMVAVRPDYKLGIIFKGWRGDGIVTTSSDILEKHTELCTFEVPSQSGEMVKKQFHPTLQSYDWQAKDFFNIASRAGVPFTPADKNRTRGYSLLNTLFKLGMLVVMDGDPELQKLVIELTSLKEDEYKQDAKDDFCDSLRYTILPIPWDFEGVAGEILKLEEGNVDTRTESEKHFDDRRSGTIQDQEEARQAIQDELDEWQGYLDG